MTSTPDLNGLAYLATIIPGNGSPATSPNLPGYFYDDPNSGNRTKIWPAPYLNTTIATGTNVGGAMPGADVLTIMDYSKYSRYNGSVRLNFLDPPAPSVGCPLLMIDVNTGQMLPRK